MAQFNARLCTERFLVEITQILVGTVSVDPGVGQIRPLDAPPGFPSFNERYPDNFFSTVQVADSADASLFTFIGFQSVAPTDPREIWLDLKKNGIMYTSTASGPIDISFKMVWTDTSVPSPETYEGD